MILLKCFLTLSLRWGGGIHGPKFLGFHVVYRSNSGAPQKYLRNIGVRNKNLHRYQDVLNELINSLNLQFSVFHLLKPF